MDKLSLGFVCFHILFSTISVVNGGMISSCSQTPYPEICNSFIKTTTPLTSSNENQFGFRNLALQATMDEAKRALQMVSSMDLNLLDDRAKLAWADCLELYEDTLSQLNRTMANPTSFDDSQTWLSASIANHQTCQNGFIDMNSSSPFILSDFSKLLSNSLAINKNTLFTKSTSGGGARRLLSDGFPAWLSAGDRKLLQASSPASRANIVVAKDGSGNYKTINEAVAASEKLSGNKRFVIYVKGGVYNENVNIKRSIKNLMFIGDGIDATVVTGSKSNRGGSTTYASATFGVSGGGFIAMDMTFENTAGPEKHQAVAFRSGSDFSVLYRCSFKGYQDTLYVYSQRQFYRNCDIYGTIDFIFGDAAVVLQSCNINARKPTSFNTVTAQARTDPNENTGISIHNSQVNGASKTYLGRPWQKYSRTVFMKCSLNGIAPAGWLEWDGNFALNTLYYGEYMNTGSGASTGGRVKWPGFHVITSATEAGKFTVGGLLGGGSWIAAVGVPFTSGL